MNCRQCENLIDDYINNSLNENDLDEFIEHIDNCHSCKNELTINYSLITALNQLDSGEELSSDYEDEINQKISSYKERKRLILRRKAYRYIFTFILGFVFTLFFLIFRNDEEIEYSSDKNATTISFDYDGVPLEYDTVNQSIDEHNVELINFIHANK